MSELWICAACGREGSSHEELRERDSSCGTWAVRVDPVSVERDEHGRIVRCAAFSEIRAISISGTVSV